MTTDDLLQHYYTGLAKKSGWETVISDHFTFVGGTGGAGIQGKTAYVEAINRFSRVFNDVAQKRSIIQGNDACVVANYSMVSPSGSTLSLDVAEVWKAKDGKLDSLAIYFDTTTWNSFMKT